MVISHLSNPIAMIFGFILLIIIARAGLLRISWFAKNPSVTSAVLIIVGVATIIYLPLLKIVALSVPLVVLVILFLAGVWAIFYALQMREESIYPFMKRLGFLRILTYILIISAVSFGASQVFGEKLLEKPSFSLSDAMSSNEEKAKIDFTPFFTSQVLDLLLIIIILGALFVFLNSAKG